MTIGAKLFSFFTQLKIKAKLPEEIEILNPYCNPEVLNINKEFYNKYYNDKNNRILLLGINPGRFGAGVTGIAFTDPINLEKALNINNNFEKKPELSATFIHQAIRNYGGYKPFFNKFLLTAVSPLGFVKNGININYYDDKELLKDTLPFIKETLKIQYDITGNQKFCGCIGQGTNYKFLRELNMEMKLFKQIIPLPHPRWVMQYRRKELDKYINKYSENLKLIVELGENY